MLEPRQIRGKEFGNKLRGNDPKEVASFLDSVASAMEELLAENNRIKTENIGLVAEAEKMRAQISEIETDKSNMSGQIDRLADRIAFLEAEEGMVKEALISARQKSEEIIDEANKDAERITSESEETQAQTRKQIESLLEDAQKEVNRLKEESELLCRQAADQADRIIKQGEGKKAALQREGEAALAAAIQKFEMNIKDDIRRWQTADSYLRQFKSNTAALLARIPDGIEAAMPINARELWESIKAKVELEPENQKTPQAAEEISGDEVYDGE